MKRENIGKAIIILTIGILLSLGLGLYNTKKLNSMEPVCIAQECMDWATGKEWVADNCWPEGEDKTMLCNLVYQNQGYVIALSEIDIDDPSIKSCRDWQCSVAVYVKNNGG